MDPTPTSPQPPTPAPGPAPDPAAAPAADSIIELIRTQRQNAGVMLAVLAFIFLAGTVWLALKASKVSATTEATKTEEKDDPFKAIQPDVPEIAKPNRDEYIFGAIGSLMVFTAFAGGAAFLLVAPPRPTEAEQRTQARQVVLVVGSAVGAVLIVAGLAFFYLWGGSLVRWLDKGEIKEARWVVIPLLMVVTGGALMFAAGQPARAEERNNPTVRKFVYGANLGLAALMVFVVLFIANAVVAMRVPGRLDTTSTGFYSLSPQTVQLLEGLEQPIHAYAILQDTGDAIIDDTKRLLQSSQDANPSKFRVTILSPALNRKEIADLKANFPMAEMSREGILLVAGEEGGGDLKRHSFIRVDELGDEKPGPEGRTVTTFNGEPKLLRELMFLAENKQRPKIYFTQSSGELKLSGAGGRGAEARRSASLLRGYLERNYFDVAELTFDIGAPAKVPDDAAVVVVADPTLPLPANGVEAIRKFMNEPRPGGGKGKLVVLTGQQRGADDKPLKTGLEPLLTGFGVQLPERFLFNVPSERGDSRDPDLGTRVTLAVITQEAVNARNPVALGFTKVSRLPLLDCREVNAAPGGTFQTLTVLASMPDRPTWTEAIYTPSPVKTWNEFVEQLQAINNGPGTADEKRKRRAELINQKQITDQPRGLAVFVSETDPGRPDPNKPPTARVAVFGCGWFVSDDASGQAARGQAATLWLDLMGSTLDWIRDRPTVTGTTEKQYTTYTLKPGYRDTMLIWVPILLSLLVVLGLGAGVWVIRRK